MPCKPRPQASLRLVVLGLAFWLVRTTQGASVADSYYSTVDASSLASLRQTLHEVIDDHVAYPYTATSTDTWNILEAADEDPFNPANVLDVYKNASYPKAGGGNSFYNREHTWPNSYGFNDLTGDSAYTDAHMLYISDSGYNSTRGNRPFADCPPSAGCSERGTLPYNGRGGGSGVYPGNSNWLNSDTFEVWSGRKGDVARAIFYMDIRYEGGAHSVTGEPEPDLIVTDDRGLIQVTPSGQFSATAYMGMLSALIAWHEQDPPDAGELRRNEVVSGYQGNRNPFIDHPEWVACLYRGDCGPPRTPSPTPTGTPATPTPTGQPTETPSPSPTRTPPPSPPPGACASELFISEYVEGSSYNKALEIYNGTGSAVVLTGRYELRRFSNGATTATSKLALSGQIEHGSVLVISHADAAEAIQQVTGLNSSVVNFNGNDAVGLYRDGLLIDGIGQIGVNPGSRWGTGAVTTADATLVRKPGVLAGDLEGGDPFQPSLEWDGYEKNDFSHLGAHGVACGLGATATPSPGAPSVPASGSGAPVLLLCAAAAILRGNRRGRRFASRQPFAQLP